MRKAPYEVPPINIFIKFDSIETLFVLLFILGGQRGLQLVWWLHVYNLCMYNWDLITAYIFTYKFKRCNKCNKTKDT